ncbi:uncharacterized protein LOC122022626 isoform X2 [Zingiber officinale]|uniref:uncharacterized protein LOC122018816 isoform X2 n=1 Tax=Zingiber officinale TaxID=94328 RepID=UPI001C4AFF3A|nr:uncharacterized protein LOC122018816 isoform X2 [Zingiber officinale]XP_042436596.1 uncharacterized protein LOC122022626 isoform X2 [Zingiber officinale]
MSLENDDPLLERSSETQRKTKVCYTRDELLSFSKLSNKLPDEFDASVLSELNETSNSVNERQRGFGGLTFQSTKHSDFTSQPPYRSEVAGSYSRGTSGRWDAQSNYRDGDLQSNRETNTQDIGRQIGIQSRCYAQQDEHDGLLGSGAFPRPSSYGRPSTEKSRATSQFQLNKTSEPYQPPRPYKAMPFQRKDNRDSCNDETFGSTNYSSEDRAGELRRRESFELIRKEQRKALQDKQNNHKHNLDPDIATLFEDSADKKSTISKTDKEDVSSLSKIQSPRSPSMHAPVSRPLVPPGFASTAMDKILPVQSNCFALETSFACTVDNKHLDNTYNDQEKGQQLDAYFDDSIRKHEVDNLSSKRPNFQNVNEVGEVAIINDVFDEKKENYVVTNSFVQNSSVSILEKLLGGSLQTYGSSSASSSNQGLKTDEEPWTSSVSVSSKFASWFVEEENRRSEDFSSKNLLSLIVNNDKVGSSNFTVSHANVFEPGKPGSTDITNTTLKFDVSPTTVSEIGISEQYHQVDKLNSSPVVLTCEDLEQSILADIEGGPSLQHTVQEPETRTGGKSEHPKSDIDEHVSQHLLSLLQRGTKKEETVSGTCVGVDFFDKLSLTGKSSLNYPVPDKGIVEAPSCSDKTLTLETLFGAAFMNELQSAQAPVSTQRVADGGTNTYAFQSSAGFPVPHSDGSFFSSSSGDYQPNKPVHHSDTLPLGTVSFDEKVVNFHLPGEQSLIIDNDALESATSDSLSFPNTRKNEELFSKMNEGHLKDSLRNAIPRGAEDIPTTMLDGSFQRPRDLVNAGALHHHLQGRTLSHTVNHAIPLHPLLNHLANGDEHMKHVNPQQNFHDPQNFLENLVPHNSYHVNAPHIDPASYHLIQQLPIPGNFPQQLPHQGFSGGMQLPHQINHVQSFVPETNNMHNIALPHQQSNYGSFGMGIPGAFVGGGGGGNHPDAFQRLMEMEMRANQKHAHPAAAGHIPTLVCAVLFSLWVASIVSQISSTKDFSRFR